MDDTPSHSVAPVPAPPEEPGYVWVPSPEPVHRIASFVSGDPHGKRLRLAFYKRPRAAAGADPLGAVGATIIARTWFGPEAEGPPGHAHGGSIAAVLDEVMGVACWENGHQVVAATIEVRFHAPLPLGTDAIVRTWITEVDGRRIRVRGEVRAGAAPDAKRFASSTGLFMEVDGGLGALFRRVMPSDD